MAVGNYVDILALQGPQTRVVDLAGRILLPGFVDGHTHILWRGRTLDESQDVALRFGFTSVTEMWADEPFLEELMQAEQSGQLRLRVNVFASYNDGILQDGEKVFVRAWYPENDPILDSDRMLRIPGIKVFVDGGSGGGRGCPALSEPYEPDFVATDWFKGQCGSDRGDLYWTQEEINQVVADAQAAGYRVAFHAMGDQGIETSLNAIEFALDGQPNERYRHQIQHNALIRPDLLERYADLDILASLRGYFNTCDQSGYVTYHGPHRYEWNANRYRLPGLGVHVYIETDFTWDVDPTDTYWSRNPNSMLQLYGLVTRQQVNKDGTICTPEPWLVPHAISVEQALRIMTIEPAYAVSQEDVIGTLEPGKYADLVILSGNPMAVDPNTIKDLEVWMTMVGGNVEYCAPGQEGLCPGLPSPFSGGLNSGDLSYASTGLCQDCRGAAQAQPLCCPEDHEVRLAPEAQRVVGAVEAVLHLVPERARPVCARV
ncbi:MAG: amidohydrolase [Anaerolineae bacterium]